MKNIKQFESFNSNNNSAELLLLYVQSRDEYRLLTKLISPNGETFSVDGMYIRKSEVETLVKKFGATIETRR